MSRIITMGVALLFLAACDTPPPPGKVREVSLNREDCNTVYLFKPARIQKPKKSVPDEYKAFSGIWSKGAWEGVVCHDLYVLSVDKDGNAQILDAHGPGFGYEATSFRRVGQISKDGRLKVRKGKATVEYWLEGGQMHGLRKEGNLQHRIILNRET